jgi:hypothetical protein
MFIVKKLNTPMQLEIIEISSPFTSLFLSSLSHVTLFFLYGLLSSLETHYNYKTFVFHFMKFSHMTLQKWSLVWGVFLSFFNSQFSKFFYLSPFQTCIHIKTLEVLYLQTFETLSNSHKKHFVFSCTWTFVLRINIEKLPNSSWNLEMH